MNVDTSPPTAQDHTAFIDRFEPYRLEIQAHCYRMLGSIHDAEDMVQETFLRAWNRREHYTERAALRAWLYKIATNACLDALKKRPRRAVPVTYQPLSTPDDPIPPSVMEPIWLEPYPDDRLPTDEHNPESRYSTRESITIAFMTALHLLPPRQRAVLILRDVLDWEASEVAEALEMSVSAVKSALHRARQTLRSRPLNPDTPPSITIETQSRLKAYVQAWESADVNGLIRLLKEDAIFSMPPIPSWYQGREVIGQLTAKTVFAGQAHGRWHLRPVQASQQIAFALYRQSDVPGFYNGYGIQVISFSGADIAEIITFRSPGLLASFRQPDSLDLRP